MDINEMSAEFNRDELIQEMYARQMVHEAYIKQLVAFIKVLLGNRRQLDSLPSAFLLQLFDESFQRQIESLMHDNPLMNEVLNRIVKNEFEDIPGVDLSMNE